ncbi:MAG TPA: sugar ABC transporter permease [Candidatus Limiplasma sp.]|nr:sugar ABC transporter permease [Candidatus Limiplasma sp.]HRX08009.1 sugar ABC transporter permease [Candidatus Limiplasma sp.]
MKQNKLYDTIFLAPGFIVYILFMIVPVVMCFYYSFTNWDGISTTFRMIGLKNFVTLFRDASFFQVLKVTVIIMVVTSVIYNVLGIILAALLNDKGKLSSISRSAIFIPTVMSAVVVAFIWSYMVQTNGGVINSIILALGGSAIDFYKTPLTTIFVISGIICWNSIGFFVVIYLSTLSTIPQELYEAAKVDGAGWFHRFRHITLPLLAPGITINCILAVAGGLKQYDHVKVITGGGPGGATQTVTLFSVEKAFEYNRRGYSSAAVIVLFIIIVILTVIQLSISKRHEVEY